MCSCVFFVILSSRLQKPILEPTVVVAVVVAVVAVVEMVMVAVVLVVVIVSIWILFPEKGFGFTNGQFHRNAAAQ